MAEIDFAATFKGVSNRVHPALNRVVGGDLIVCLVRWNNSEGVVDGVVRADWKSSSSAPKPIGDISWAWDTSTYWKDGDPKPNRPIPAADRGTIFPDDYKLRTKNPASKSGGIRQQDSDDQSSVIKWFVYSKDAAGAASTIDIGDQLEEEEAEAAETSKIEKEKTSTLNTMLASLQAALNASKTADTDDVTILEKQVQTTQEKVDAQSKETKEALNRETEIRSDLSKTVLSYSSSTLPEGDESRFRNNFINLLNTNSSTASSLSKWTEKDFKDDNKVHRVMTGRLLWGILYNKKAYFAQEDAGKLILITEDIDPLKPRRKGWVRYLVPPPTGTAGAGEPGTAGEAAKATTSASGGASTASAPMCDSMFNEEKYRKTLEAAMQRLNLGTWWQNLWNSENDTTRALKFSKNRVFRNVVQSNGKDCIWRGIMVAHHGDIVIFFIDPTTGALGNEHEISGWYKGWHTFGKTNGIQAQKPKGDLDKLVDSNTLGAAKPEDDASDDGPLTKQFTALFARLRDLEARLAPPQTPQIVRDARPVREHLDELREKIARTRSLISRDVAGLRRVHV